MTKIVFESLHSEKQFGKRYFVKNEGFALGFEIKLEKKELCWWLQVIAPNDFPSSIKKLPLDGLKLQMASLVTQNSEK